MMKWLIKAVDGLALVLYWISGFLLVVMMLSVVFDVVSRGLFAATDGNVDITFVGGIELVKYSLLFSMICAFPYAVDKGQIVVDLFTQGWSDRTQRWTDGFYTLCFGIFGGLLCWRFALAGEEAEMSGELTQDLLMPMSPIYWVASFALAVLALRGVVSGLAQWVGPLKEANR
jgi:TRAP-type mannitol/chloroaromatic compound transport system permease small subunit